jgi:ABC-2 type transport system permease protein
MTAHVTTSAPGSAPLSAPSVRRRLFGLGSVFGKTLRDSRRAVLVVGGILAMTIIAVTAAIASQFTTPESREELVAVIASVPAILQGLAGKPVNVGTLGGYMSYKYGVFFPLVVSLWSIIALSGTLAAETRRGSMEFVASTPLPRRRIALQKVGAHIIGVGLASLLVFVSIAIAGSAFAILPGDEIPPLAAFGYALWMFLVALASGSIAFALAPFLGRGAAAGIAGAIMFGGFILNGYQAAIPELAPFAQLTWWGWTSNHLPLAGQYDWASLIPVAVVVVVLVAVGVEAFARRDLGATSAIPTPGLPGALAGVGGPTGRAAAEGLPSALAWGIGIGIFGLLIAGSGSSFVETLNKSPEFLKLIQQIFPDVDIGSVGGFLELLFVEFGMILAGLAAATLVGVWASDETSGRLEFLLATPLSRRRWVTAGGVALIALVVVVTVASAIGIAIGAVIAGGDLVTPTLGTAALGLYAAAVAGFGVAVGGIFGTRVAAGVAAIAVILTWFADVVVPALGLPGFVHSLALTTHFGHPMVGQWDPVGIVASVAIAVIGVALGAWGFHRRDLRG